MLRFVAISLFLTTALHSVIAQEMYREFQSSLAALYNAKDKSELDRYWNELVSLGKIPLVEHDSVAFLYRGEARSINWMGDFNGWGSSKIFNNKGSRIPQTNIWILKASLPADARLDYKILINAQDLILDPVNPSHQWSGVGGGSLNSELRMHHWRQDTLTSRLVNDAHPGMVIRDLLFNSRELGYQVTYNVYIPRHYEISKVYPVVYVTDGYEYMHDRMGNMPTILDNLIHLRRIEPVVVVFIDHRDPVNRSHNKRMTELAMNEKYLNFMIQELMPSIEGNFSVSKLASHRAIVGTSIGGLMAAWTCLSRPDVFSLAGIQSPAFWFKPEIYSLCDQSQIPPQKIFLSTGLIHDVEDGVRKMRVVLDRKQYDYTFKTVNQGHSWGNWRDLIDDMFIYLFPVRD